MYDLKFRIILNSRGQKTVECEIFDRKNRIKFLSSTPSGASTGSKEVFAFPVDGLEKGLKRIKKVENDIKKVRIEEFDDLVEIEKIIEKVDKSENKQLIGGNLILALEYSLLKYFSFLNGKEIFEFIFSSLFKKQKIKMPIPLGNVIGGGAHSPNSLDIQEILLLPNYKSFRDNYFINAQIHQEIKKVLLKKVDNFIAAKTDEGAWALSVRNEEAISYLYELIEFNNYKVNLGLDMAATELLIENHYFYKKDGKMLSREEQLNYVLELIDLFNLKYVEDPVEENDEEGFSYLVKKTRDCWIVGDDFICTNPKLLEKRIDKIKGSIVKPNQIGSLIKTLEVIKMLNKKEKIAIISHRSGETEDNILAHLAVGFQVPIIKTGIVGGERTVKLNELLRIEEIIKEN